MPLLLLSPAHRSRLQSEITTPLPYRDPAELALVLQDVDLVTASTESTSILSESGMIGQRKTRAMAEWAERRGFRASIQERLFAADFKRQPEEPAIALCGTSGPGNRLGAFGRYCRDDLARIRR